MFHVLDCRAIWVKEFASALAKIAPTLGWVPSMSLVGVFRNHEHDVMSIDPLLRLRRFPLQRGFARPLIRASSRPEVALERRLSFQSADAARCPLICSSPHYAGVAARWPGPVVYYVTDFFAAYGEKPARILSLDRQMSETADLVFPNSRRIADYLIYKAGFDRRKVFVIPNATRAANVMAAPALTPSTPPADASDMERPIAGVIGNLAANLDWKLLVEVIKGTPWLSWLFVGPTEMNIEDKAQSRARELLMDHGGRVRFAGYKNYGLLAGYARAVDVAVLPYMRREPTYSGSSTRFYEHLAASRPILATRAFDELLSKEPLLRLVDDAQDMIGRLEDLRETGFEDGYERLRWQESLNETWEARARVVKERISALAF